MDSSPIPVSDVPAVQEYNRACSRVLLAPRRDVLRLLGSRGNKFAIPGDMSEQELVAFLSVLSYSSVQVLKITDVSIGDDAAASLASAVGMSQCPLRRIWLKSNQLSPVGCGSIARSLASNGVLEEFILEDNVIADTTVFGEFLLKNKTLRRLSLIGCWIDSEETEALASFLRRNPHSSLTKIDLSRNSISSQGCAALAKSLPHLPLLEEFSVAFNPIGNDGVEHLAMQFARFSTLDLRGCGIGVWGVEKIASVAMTVPVQNLKWKIVLLDDNRVASRGCLALAKELGRISGLEELSLVNTKIGEKGAIALSRASANHPNLRRIVLSNNLVADNGALGLCFAASGNPRLEFIGLDLNFISEEGEAKIIQELQKTGSVQRVDVTRQQVRETAADGSQFVLSIPQEESMWSYMDDDTLAIRALTDAYRAKCVELDVEPEQVLVKYMENVASAEPDRISTCLSFRGMKLTEVSLQLVAEIVENVRCLLSLDLDSCGMSAESARSLAESLKASPSSQLCSLHVGSNQLGVDGSVAILEAVARSTTLREIDISSCGLTDRAILVLSETLVSNHSSVLATVNISGNPRLTAAAMVHLCLLLEKCQAPLSKLTIDDCGLVDSNVVRLLESFDVRHQMGLSAIMSLSVCANNLGEVFGSKLVSMLRNNKAACPRRIFLDGNSLGDAVCIDIAEAAARSNGLDYLSLRNCSLSSSCKSSILSLLPQVCAVENVETSKVENTSSVASVPSASTTPIPSSGLPALYKDVGPTELAVDLASNALPSDITASEIRSVLEQIRVLEKKKETLLAQFRTQRDYERELQLKSQVSSEISSIPTRTVPPLQPVSPEERIRESNATKSFLQRIDTLNKDTVSAIGSVERLRLEKGEIDSRIQRSLHEMEDVEKALRDLLSVGKGKIDDDKAEVLDARKVALEETVYTASLHKAELVGGLIQKLKAVSFRLEEIFQNERARQLHLAELLGIPVDQVSENHDLSNGFTDIYSDTANQLQRVLDLHDSTEEARVKLMEVIRLWNAGRDDLVKKRESWKEAERLEERLFADVMQMRQTVREAFADEVVTMHQLGVPLTISTDVIRANLPRAHERYSFLAPFADEFMQLSDAIRSTHAEQERINVERQSWEETAQRRSAAVSRIEEFSALRREVDRNREKIRDIDQKLSSMESLWRSAQEDMQDALATGDLVEYRAAQSTSSRLQQERETMLQSRTNLLSILSSQETESHSVLDDVESINGAEYQELLLLVHMEREKRIRKKLGNATLAIGAFRRNAAQSPST
eukprot:ANDGO_07897.mRNA.1 hypothetical protein PTSG_09285